MALKYTVFVGMKKVIHSKKMYLSTSRIVTESMSRTHEWARANRDLANEYLSPPSSDDENVVSSAYSRHGDNSTVLKGSDVNALENYLRYRKWNVDQSSKPYSLNLISHVLSFPLTLAHHGSLLLDRGNTRDKKESAVRIGCIGARSESTLPHHYWKEMVYYSSYFNSFQEINIDFLGLDVIANDNRGKKVSYVSENGEIGNIQLSLHRGILERHHLEKHKWDLLVLFNPGLNHPNLYDSWKYSWDVIKDSEIPVMLTAHSYVDAKRDAEIVFPKVSDCNLYDLNMFASRMEFNDPFDTNHIVRPNLYIASL